MSLKVFIELALMVQFLGEEPHHSSVSCHAVVAAHIEELTIIHNDVLGLCGESEEGRKEGRKKEED